MYDTIHEKISVVAEFTGAQITIKSFTWKEHLYDVLAVNLKVKANHGEEVVWLFSVSTATAAFKLRFDTGSLQWYLEELTWDETQPQIA